jgi:hypothetical protein
LSFPRLSVPPGEITPVARRRFRRCAQAGLFSLALFPALAVRATAADPKADNHPPVKMERFVVNDKHLLCFGIALELWDDKNSERVMAMYVKAVAPGSMAEQEGIVPGTRIYTIEGIPVENFEATFRAGSELNKLFVDRQSGDHVTLEVKFLGKWGTKFITLVQNPGMKVTISTNHPKAP